MNLPERMVAIHAALSAQRIRHAFGGALALAWCTERARGTIDIDLNVFSPPDAAARVGRALPSGVRCSEADIERMRDEGQVRLWWDATPIDVFCSTTPFHAAVERRIRWESFLGEQLPFLACADLAVFKVFFDRTQDWADLEAMAAAGTLDVEAVLGTVVRYLGGEDHRIERLRSLG